MVDRLRRAPAWAWLAVIVGGSIVLRAWLGSRMPAPFIFTDELHYQENARSLAGGGGYLVRDVPYGIASILYPLLLAPAYVLFDSLPDAYAAARTINAAAMSLAAVPAFLIARRLLPPGLSALGALLAVALPSLAYTGTLMSENLFYPVFLLAALALIRALEQPTLARQALLLAVCGVAVLTRAQAVALLLAVPTAPLILRLIARRPLRPWLPSFAVVAGGALLVLVVQLARGASLASLFGAYRVVGEESYDVGEVIRFVFWHVAELDLYLCVIPLAAFALLVARARSLEPNAQAFVAATLALATWTILVVATFASRFAGAIEERNTFMLAPLILIGMLVWIDRGLPRPRALAVVVACVAAVLPALIPYERFLQLKVRSDTLMIVPLWNVQDEVGLARLDTVVLLGGIVAAALFLLVPRRYALVLPGVVLAVYALAVHPIHAGPHGMEQAAAGAIYEGISRQRDWVDRAVGGDDEVAVLYTGLPHRFTVLQNEFFNRSIGRVYTSGGPMDGGLPETPVTVDERTGQVRRSDDGSVVRAQYVLTDGSVSLDGEPVAIDRRLGLTLYRTSGPLFSTTRVTGVYNDQWSGPEVGYERLRCRGGTLRVTVEGDPGLSEKPQTVVAHSGSRRVVATVPARELVTLVVPLEPRAGMCSVRFTVSPTRIPGPQDTRELGTHFRAFEYDGP